jgi:hypothetical protein
VEASANGPAPQKAAWLTKLGQAVSDFPQVHALLYHEGGPELNASKTQIKSWSLTSDPASLAAMRKIVLNLRQQPKADVQGETGEVTGKFAWYNSYLANKPAIFGFINMDFVLYR